MTRGGGRSRSTTERCSFCDKSKHEVDKLIQGGKPGIYICNTCVEICHSILHDSATSGTAPPIFLFSSLLVSDVALGRYVGVANVGPIVD